jgi:uncharacterized protein (DUF2164 family)
MAIELKKQETADLIPSLQKYFREELDQDLSELQARFLLKFILQEIAPFAYNQGVADAEAFFRSKIEDLPGTCFEPPQGYWPSKRKKSR